MSKASFEANPGNGNIRAFSKSYFYVDIGDNSPNMRFSELSGLKVETELFSIEEGGENSKVHRFPTRTKYGNLILKRGIATTQEFFKWHQKIVSGQFETRNITVIMAEIGDKIIARWDFTDAFPVAWTGPDFVAGESALAIETLEIAHQGFKLVPSPS